MSEEYGRAARGGDYEVGGKIVRKMTAAAFDCVARKPQRQPGAVDGAEDLRECNVEIAQTRVRGLLLLILLLGLLRQAVLQVPRLVRERAMLRHQQQSRQQYLQQTAFQDH